MKKLFVLLSSGYFMAITETNLQNYSGMVMQADGKNGVVVKMAHHQPASHSYNVRTFGAVGDGVVNDRDAIEKAIDAAAVAGGGTI